MEKEYYQIHGKETEKVVGTINTTEKSMIAICNYLNKSEIAEEQIVYKKITELQHKEVKKCIEDTVLNH